MNSIEQIILKFNKETCEVCVKLKALWEIQSAGGDELSVLMPSPQGDGSQSMLDTVCKGEL